MMSNGIFMIIRRVLDANLQRTVKKIVAIPDKIIDMTIAFLLPLNHLNRNVVK